MDVRLACAVDDLQRVHPVARLLEAAGFNVRIAAGHASRAEAGDPSRFSEILVAAWSDNAASSPHVRHWVRANAGRPLVEFTLDGVFPSADGSIEGLEARAEEPIDFQFWAQRDRGSATWKELERRIRRAANPPAPISASPAIAREPWAAAIALGVVATSALGLALAARFGAPASPTMTAEPAANSLDPAPLAGAHADPEGGAMVGIGLGGPALAEPEDAVDPSIIETRIRRVRPLQAQRAEDHTLQPYTLRPPLGRRDLTDRSFFFLP